jgi:hypothetical protein
MELGLARPGTPEPVDKAVAGGRGQPRPGVARDTILGPSLHRSGEGILRALLGKIPVAAQPNEGSNDASPLGPVRGRNCRLHAGHYGSQIGLTSIVPWPAAGIF